MGFNSLEREKPRERNRGNFIWHLYAYLLCFLFLRFLFKHVPKKILVFGVDLCKCQRGRILFYEENCTTRSYLY